LHPLQQLAYLSYIHQERKKQDKQNE